MNDMIHGIMNVYKEKGYTSHDVVARLRGITKQKKIGHTGTLDPDATGVLPVCLGKATKLCGMLTDTDKIYEAVLLLGRETDTQDTSGEIIRECNTDSLDEKAVRETIESFEGDYNQIPPMYSALKVNGKKLYELAREGKTIERKPRKVQIYEIRILELNLPRVRMEVRCSKGTYIRTLCHDIGQALSCGGCMEELMRTKAGGFQIMESMTLAQIENKMQDESWRDIVTPVDQMFASYKAVVVRADKAALAYNGNAVAFADITNDSIFEDGEKVRLYDEAGHFIAIYEYGRLKDRFNIVKMFFDKNDIDADKRN